MLERIVLLGALFILAGLFSIRHRITRNNLHVQLPVKFSNANALPTILYFWTDQCVQCKTSQKPALNKLQSNNKGFNLISVNAVDERELVSLYKIKTVPSTIIFDADGKSRFINNGFADDEKLAKQIENSLN
jgi:thioredoxin-like negative regulator of GroEL